MTTITTTSANEQPLPQETGGYGRWTTWGGWEPLEVSDAQDRAYRALETAAERIGANNYAQMGPVRFNRKHERVGGYYVTEEHAAVIAAMPQVLNGQMSPQEAMAMLHDEETFRQRVGERRLL